MKSRFQIAGHPVHPMLISFPIALYTVALLGDILFLLLGDPFWYRAAFLSIAIGLIGNLAAAVPGIVDYHALSKEAPEARMAGMIHMGTGLMLALLYAVNLFLRGGAQAPPAGGLPTLPLLLNIIGNGLLGIQGWYGGELVYRYGIGVPDMAQKKNH